MKNTKRSIAFKIIAGYVLAALLAVIAFGVIYSQLNTYTRFTEIKNENNEKLFLVGQTLTSLYEAESLTRNIIQTSDIDKFQIYKAKIDTILHTISKLANLSNNAAQIEKLDSITCLIDSKNENLEELMDIYELREEKGIYRTAIDELKKTNESFGNPNYDQRFKNLTPEFRKTLINILKLSKKDNEKRLTNQTVDSLANRVREVLTAVDKKDRELKREIFFKESKLLKNDQILTKQLRSILAAIELSERNQYYARLKASDDILSKTATIILIVAAASIGIAILFIFFIIKDISKSQQYRNALEAEKLYKESLLQTRESLINTVTHDLRSPLNTVIGYADLLEKTILTAKQKHYLNYLKKSSDYILHLVNDLLDLSKLEAGKMGIETLPFCPEKLIQDTVSDVTTFNEKRGLHIAIHIDPKLKQQYLGDPFRIKQIITNLVNNAYKFTDRGTITIQSKLDTSDDATPKLVIAVIDTGIGISKAQQQSIFEEFSQGDTSTEKKQNGFGLGLSITKKIVRLLNGEIHLESTLGKGSTFTVVIPIQASETRVNETDHEMVKTFSSEAHINVLVVDDDPHQLALTSEVVSAIGLHNHGCDTVDKALELIQKHTFHLILTDIQMPLKDGFEFLALLQQNELTSKIPIIALSGRTDISKQEYKDMGFYGSLRKPYTPQSLIDLIAQTISIQKPQTLAKPLVSAGNKDIPYSLEDLILFAQGDKNSLLAILNTFYESTIENTIQLHKALDKRDTNEIKKIAHRILPMFRQIKAKEVITILEQLEHQERYGLSESHILTRTQQGIATIEVLTRTLKKEYPEIDLMAN